jgi:hypothetical protein
MFKVGDRVKRVGGGTLVPEGTIGTVQYIHPSGAPVVDWANGHTGGPYVHTQISLITTHTWQVGDEFELMLEEGTLVKGKLTHTPGNGGEYRGIDSLGGCLYSSFWFEAHARPTLATHTYKPGDTVKYTGKTWQSLVGRTGVVAKLHDSGTVCMCEFGDKFWNVELTDISPISMPTDSPPLSCIRCEDFFPMAEPNLPDGGFACWSCRKYHAYAIRALT